MINNEYPVLDGIAPSWADIQVKQSLGGGIVSAALLDLKDIKSINTGGAVEVGHQRGVSGGRVRKTTTGQVDYTASITLYLSGWQKMLAAAAVLAPVRGAQRAVSLVHFGITIFWTPPGDVLIYERRVKGCRIVGHTLNDQEGSDPTEVECPLDTKEIADVIGGVEIVLL